MYLKVKPRWWAAVLSCALAACGGGGGSDGGESGPDITSDRTSLNVVRINDTDAQVDSINFTMHGGSGTYYAMATSDSNAVALDIYFSSDTSATVIVAPQLIPRGTRASGTLTFHLCRDEACSQEVWHQNVSFTSTNYAIDTSELTLSSGEGEVAAPVSRSISPQDTTDELKFTAEKSPYLSLDHSQGSQMTVTASGVGRAAGSYSSAVDIAVISQGNAVPITQQIPVSYTIGPGIVAPAVSALNLTTKSTASDLQGSAAIRFAGSQTPAWTASSDSAWLVLDNRTGTGPGALNFHVDTTLSKQLTNSRTHTATVTLSATGLSDVIFPVTLNKQLTDVAMTTPSGVLSGMVNTVRVTGRGFTGLSAADFSVGGTAPTAVTIESDTAARLTLPALSAGTLTVSVASMLGDQGAAAALGVRDPNTLAASSVNTSGIKRAALFDASRNAVFATVYGQNSLVRFKLVSGQWQVNAVPVDQVGYLALAPDAKTLYVASGSRLLAIDPDSLQTLHAYTAPFPLDGGYLYDFPIPVSHDMRLWFGGDQWDGVAYFDLLDKSFRTQATDSRYAAFSPRVGGSSDGSLVTFETGSLTPDQPVQWYSAATAAVTVPAGSPLGGVNARFDAAGKLALIDRTKLYRVSDFSLQGNIAVSVGSTAWDSQLSPDGRRAYALVALDGAHVMDHVEVFDTTRFITGTTNFVQLGQIPLTTQAVACNLDTDWVCDARGRMFLDPTGTVLFWIGDAKLVVMPISASLSGISAAGKTAAQGLQLKHAQPASSRR